MSTGPLTHPIPFNVYMDAEMREMKIGMGRMGVRFMENIRE